MHTHDIIGLLILYGTIFIAVGVIVGRTIGKILYPEPDVQIFVNDTQEKESVPFILPSTQQNASFGMPTVEMRKAWSNSIIEIAGAA